MNSYFDLARYLSQLNYKFILAADAQPRTHKRNKAGEIIEEIPGGGVAVALDPVARASHATYIARGRTPEDKEVLRSGRVTIGAGEDEFTLRRLFFNEAEMESYYYGFSNQTMWPLCHVAFEQPTFRKEWFEGYSKVNQQFAKVIKEELRPKTFVWIHDYQLCLVPQFVGRQKDVVMGMFWHIPWPTWEVFRILPFKKQILESFLHCDFLAFHRGYHVRNFLETVERELEVRIDQETNTIYHGTHKTVVTNLPLGIDVDVIKSMAETEEKETSLVKTIKSFISGEMKEPKTEKNEFETFLSQHKVMLGVDRLDYTKGLQHRLWAIDLFLEKNPQYIGKVVYLGLLQSSREAIPSYQVLKKEVKAIAHNINVKYARNGWLPIYLINTTFPRKDLIRFYQKATVCLVTPRDDGMNLVSKEFVVASSLVDNPGMLVLSRFAGSAIDLTQAIIVNPYDRDDAANGIKRALEMSQKEKKQRIQTMTETLEERNVYEWAQRFVKEAISAARENRNK